MSSLKIGQLVGRAALLLLALVLFGCGSGGTTPSKNDSNVRLKTSQLLPSGAVCGALDLTLHFPQGITVQLDSTTGEPLPSVVKLVGATDPAMTFTVVKYTPATSTSQGSLRFQIYNLLGFTSNGNEYIDLQLDITPGFTPKTSDFWFSNFTVSDLNGNVIPLATPTATIEII
jgi:hypothetical protein